MQRLERILVVDDDEIILMVWRDALTKHAEHWSVETAASGDEALAKFGAAHFDLVVTDLRMPNMDGCQLTEAIRRIDKMVPILWITAFPEPNSAPEAKRLGVYRCLNKPVSVSKIRQIVGEILNGGTAEN